MSERVTQLRWLVEEVVLVSTWVGPAKNYPSSLSTDMWSKNIRWMMGRWIDLPRSMDTKVGKIRA